MGILTVTADAMLRATRVVIRTHGHLISIKLEQDLNLAPGSIRVRETHSRFGGPAFAARTDGTTLVLAGPHVPAVKNISVQNTGDATAIGHGSFANTGITRRSAPQDAPEVTFRQFTGPKDHHVQWIRSKHELIISVGSDGCDYAVI